MPIIKLTANSTLRCDDGMLERGANVEVSLRPGEGLFPDKIQEAFYRKYGKRPDITSCQCALDREEL